MKQNQTNQIRTNKQEKKESKGEKLESHMHTETQDCTQSNSIPGSSGAIL